MGNKENHQKNVRNSHGIFWHGRYYDHGQVKPNEKKKKGKWLLLRRQKRIEAMKQ